MIGGDEKPVRGDQKSGSQINALPCSVLSLIFEHNPKAFCFDFGPRKLDAFNRQLLSLGDELAKSRHGHGK